MRRPASFARRSILRSAVAAAILAAAGGVSAQLERFSKNAELLPTFPDAALKDHSVIFSNAHYEAWVSKEGFLRATPLKNGKPAGPTVRLLSPYFRGSKDKGGFVINEEVENMRAETKLPVRQPTTAVRYRADAEFGARLSVSILFGERTIDVDAKFSRTKGTGSTVAHPAAVISALPGLARTIVGPVPEDLLTEFEGKYIDLIPESGAPLLISFSDNTRKMELPGAKEFVIRGLWDGVALRGRALSRGFAFRYRQYKGHMPAQGFWFLYALNRFVNSTKVSFEFEPYDGAAIAPPAGGPGRK